ncbi:hypothetical protein FACS1894186_8540 [Alphaproteobacteria bacterium]|nr:hypothetical protein FACS1894186_8540 [Alphaproteobacteria bacterium]
MKSWLPTVVYFICLVFAGYNMPSEMGKWVWPLVIAFYVLTTIQYEEEVKALQKAVDTILKRLDKMQ